jgi:hypothetical protein
MTKLLFSILGFLAISSFVCIAESTSNKTNAIPRSLMVASSSTPVTGGTVTLHIDPLHLKGGCYVGAYHIKVSPYFFRNEDGDLSMNAPEKSVRDLSEGLPVVFTGKATSHKGKVKLINGTITPAGKDKHEGTVSLWFMSGDTKMTFNTTYRAEKN